MTEGERWQYVWQDEMKKKKNTTIIIQNFFARSAFEAFAPNGRRGRGQKYGTDVTPTTGLDHKGDSGDVRKALITIEIV